MSQTEALTNPAAGAAEKPHDQRRLANAVWEPFLQFKLLMYMLGSTALVAVLLGTFLYFAFSDLITVFTGKAEASGYYGEMIEIQLVHLFRYCGALFVLYILLLAAVCIAYTHKLMGPLRPFSRHVDELTRGNYDHRVVLRKGDLDLYRDYAERLNALAVTLEMRENEARKQVEQNG
ncbi:MAG: hypothetical protein CSB44_06265 [Gammaproteobacteria bacterium]|nr:MAG: hypothetical protein CSB44_06265 [Gammaproteobacteria bacterium]